MTEQEAIEWLANDTSPMKIHIAEMKKENPMEYINSAIEVAIKCMEKQIAKKPKVKQLGEDIEVKCPTCSDYHMFINANRGNDYCSTCGQKLDWGNEDDRD